MLLLQRGEDKLGQKESRILQILGIEIYVSNNYKWNNSSPFLEDTSSREARYYVAIPATAKNHF